jgi:hypothetical protein
MNCQRAIQAAVVIALLASAHCQKSPVAASTVSGTWNGLVSPSHSTWLSIEFTQTPAGLRGLACAGEPFGSPTPGGANIFNGVPVTIDYPDVSLQTPLPNGVFRFSGRFGADATISGESSINGQGSSRMSLARTPNGGSCGN